MIRHIVLIRPRQGLATGRMGEIMAGLRGLQDTIPGILAVASGPNTSPEGLDRGYAQAFTVDFVDAEARDDYLPHPDHRRVGAMIIEAAEGGIEGILVADFEV